MQELDDPNIYAVTTVDTWLLALGWKPFTSQTDQKITILKVARPWAMTRLDAVERKSQVFTSILGNR